MKIPTDNANRAIQGKVAMQWCNPISKFWTNANYGGPIWNCGPFWWPNLQSVQVAPSGGQNCNQWMRHHMVAKFSTCKRQVAPSSGQIRDQFKGRQVMLIFRTDPSGTTCCLRDYSSYGLNFWVRCTSGNVLFYSLGEECRDEACVEKCCKYVGKYVGNIDMKICWKRELAQNILHIHWRPPAEPFFFNCLCGIHSGYILYTLSIRR